MMKVVSDAIRIDDAPMERFEFSGSRRDATLEVDDDEGRRITIRFTSVMGFRFAPMFDRKDLLIDGVYHRTLLELERSPWVADLRELHRVAQEPFDDELAHYVVPSDDGVWELVAKSIRFEIR